MRHRQGSTTVAPGECTPVPSQSARHDSAWRDTTRRVGTGPKVSLRHLWAIAVAVCAAATLAGCSIHLTTAPGSLPDLKAGDALRDIAARTEAATQARAAQLAGQAASCPQCQTTLNQIASDAQKRLDALGGLWNPWGPTPPEDAQNAAPVAQAPLDPQAFATWMWEGGQRDLTLVAQQTDLPGSQAQTLATNAAARIVAAAQVASTYGGTVTDGEDAVARMIDAMSVAAPPYQDVTGLFPDLDASKSQAEGWPAAVLQSGEAQPAGQSSPFNAWLLTGHNSDATAGWNPVWPEDSEDLADSDQLSQAVTVWDCAAQTYPKTQVVDDAMPDAADAADRLLMRATTVLDHGVLDRRSAHCQMTSDSPADVAAGVLQADLSVFASDNPDVRRIVAPVVADDALTLGALTDSDSAPTWLR